MRIIITGGTTWEDERESRHSLPVISFYSFDPVSSILTVIVLLILILLLPGHTPRLKRVVELSGEFRGNPPVSTPLTRILLLSPF